MHTNAAWVTSFLSSLWSCAAFGLVTCDHVMIAPLAFFPLLPPRLPSFFPPPELGWGESRGRKGGERGGKRRRKGGGERKEGGRREREEERDIKKYDRWIGSRWISCTWWWINKNKVNQIRYLRYKLFCIAVRQDRACRHLSSYELERKECWWALKGPVYPSIWGLDALVVRVFHNAPTRGCT